MGTIPMHPMPEKNRNRLKIYTTLSVGNIICDFVFIPESSMGLWLGYTIDGVAAMIKSEDVTFVEIIKK